MKKIDAIPEVLVNSTCELGEGPLWDAERNAICWVDILRGEIHEYFMEQLTHRRTKLDDMVGTIALAKSGFIAAMRTGIVHVDAQTGATRHLVHPEKDAPGNRYNDGKCDITGRLWVGSMAVSEEEGAGSLYMIGEDLSYAKKISGVSVSNGLTWSQDQKTFYYIDSPTREIVSYDFNVESGDISNRRVVVHVPEKEGFPDGMTIDQEGMLWVAHWDGWQVARWDPHSGEKLFSISLPVAHVTSCIFGGKNLDDLFITTARKGLPSRQLEDQPMAGNLFIIRNCGFKGFPANRFNYDPSKAVK